jgi:RNA polymerase sigma factor (sigma-70 family)
MDIAKDIVQDAFEVLWNNRESVQAEKAKQYLFTVVYRKGIDVFRKEKNDVEINDSHLNLHINHGIEKDYSDREFIKKAMSHLPETHRKLILLRDLEGYDYKEIEEITGLNQSQVKVYLFRARKMLKETITRMEAI